MATVDHTTDWVPDHVPAHLAWDEDYDRFAASEPDPFRKVGKLHGGPDILYVRHLCNSPLGRLSGWLPTRQSLIREILADTDHFVSGAEQGMMSTIGLEWKLIPLELDPPEQQRYRKVLEPFFSPASINALDDAVRAACEELIAPFADADGCEFASEFAEKFPSYIFLDLMGMPRERLGDFLKWERAMLRPSQPADAVEAMTAILDYLTRFVREQQVAPVSDLMKGIVGARLPGGEPLTETEIVSICYILYIGGLDTVYSTLGWIMWHVARDVALQDRLRANPDEMTKAVEELLRAYSAASTQRRVKSDVEFHGVRMKAGDVVQISLPLASRDPAAYDDPHSVDLDRPVRHIAFGTGPHTCLGLRLAKREIRIVLEAFLARFRNIRIAPGETHDFHTGNVFGIDRLPLVWDRIEG
ncbi:MAG: cytochrome P450 [Novosphingobium sp.]|nr:cytochrome P450 [Novosphingobium sp.]